MTEELKVKALTESFDKSGLIWKDRAEALAAFQQDHEISYDDDGNATTVYSGERQPLHTALAAYGAGNREQIDARSLPRPSGVRSKADLKTYKEKSDFISRFGGAAFEKLPLRDTSPSEIVFREDFHALPRIQKAEMVGRDPDILYKLPPRPTTVAGMTSIGGSSKVNVSGLEKQRRIRPNK